MDFLYNKFGKTVGDVVNIKKLLWDNSEPLFFYFCGKPYVIFDAKSGKELNPEHKDIKFDFVSEWNKEHGSYKSQGNPSTIYDYRRVGPLTDDVKKGVYFSALNELYKGLILRFQLDAVPEVNFSNLETIYFTEQFNDVSRSCLNIVKRRFNDLLSESYKFSDEEIEIINQLLDEVSGKVLEEKFKAINLENEENKRQTRIQQIAKKAEKLDELINSQSKIKEEGSLYGE